MRLYFLLSYLPANYPSVLLALSPVDASSFSHLLVGALYTFTELAPSVPWIAKCLFPVYLPFDFILPSSFFFFFCMQDFPFFMWFVLLIYFYGC